MHTRGIECVFSLGTELREEELFCIATESINGTGFGAYQFSAAVLGVESSKIQSEFEFPAPFLIVSIIHFFDRTYFN